MSCYICNICETLIDSDWYGCEVDPKDDTKLICLNCAENIDEHDCHISPEDSCTCQERKTK